MNSGSSLTFRLVLFPLSPCSRHANPGLRSASALISSSQPMKSAMTTSSSGATARPTLSWAIW